MSELGDALAMEQFPPRAQELDVTVIYKEHGAFVWASLSRLSVRDADLEDMLQEVFVIAHAKLASFRGDAHVRTWLFEICRRVARNYRRKASHRRETQSSDAVEVESLERNPEQAFVQREEQRRVEEILWNMDVDKRAIFVMFEAEHLRAEEIAEMLGVPPSTVRSRIAAARKEFGKEARRLHLLNESREKRT